MGRRVKNCVTVAPWLSAVLDGLDGLPLIERPWRPCRASVAEPDHSSVDGDGSTPERRRGRTG